MIRKNIYSRITESIVNAYHDNNLDSAMDDGHEMENMGKKIVAIITADPDSDLDWESEYEPFGATELSDEDEKEAMEHEGMESDHELCPSCGYDVDCEGDECEDDENDDMEDLMIGGSGIEDESDNFEDMDVKDILIDILQELKGEDSEEEGAFETSDENPMFGGSEESDDEEDDDDEEDYDSMLSSNDSDWGNEYSDSDSDSDSEDDEEEDDYDEEEDFEDPTEVDDSIFNAPQEQEEDEVYTFDALDNA